VSNIQFSQGSWDSGEVCELTRKQGGEGAKLVMAKNHDKQKTYNSWDSLVVTHPTVG
jgi:hypothetical protein